MIARSSVMLIAFATAMFAQNPDAANVCWRPRPLANCKTWIVTEAALEMPVVSTSSKHLLVGYQNGEGYFSNDFDARLALTAGVMRNRGPKTAAGLTLSMQNGDLPGRIEGRYRRWLGPASGIDLSAGITQGRFRGAYDPDEVHGRGITASAGVSATYIGADARVDLMRTADGRNVHGLYVTARTGSRAGPIVLATGFALFLGLYYLATRGEYT